MDRSYEGNDPQKVGVRPRWTQINGEGLRRETPQEGARRAHQGRESHREAAQGRIPEEEGVGALRGDHPCPQGAGQGAELPLQHLQHLRKAWTRSRGDPPAHGGGHTGRLAVSGGHLLPHQSGRQDGGEPGLRGDAVAAVSGHRGQRGESGNARGVLSQAHARGGRGAVPAGGAQPHQCDRREGRQDPRAAPRRGGTETERAEDHGPAQRHTRPHVPGRQERDPGRLPRRHLRHPA
ncbi:MAG: hypothetical protein BWX71_02866 [Deltaproteobacteria bacterium ADurb.Bin072]|nr:MAG: hypothetical protein BWX71_02866 [Deltaproteobacteria bacterium ADurb.Bin072]